MNGTIRLFLQYAFQGLMGTALRVLC